MPTFKDFAPGCTLISSEDNFRAPPASKAEVDQYRTTMQRMFRSDRLPPVRYKGKILAERVLA